ncbi:hypothetical protein AOLI_G00316710 [Acnodon oligacanthus]
MAKCLDSRFLNCSLVDLSVSLPPHQHRHWVHPEAVRLRGAQFSEPLQSHRPKHAFYARVISARPRMAWRALCFGNAGTGFSVNVFAEVKRFNARRQNLLENLAEMLRACLLISVTKPDEISNAESVGGGGCEFQSAYSRNLARKVNLSAQLRRPA